MKNLLIIFLYLLVNTIVNAQMPIPGKGKVFAKHNLAFTENKGQITDQFGNPRSDIQFRSGSDGVNVFIGCGQIHYQFTKKEKTVQDSICNKNGCKFKQGKKTNLCKNNFCLENDKKLPYTTPISYQIYRLDMCLEGANPIATAITENKQAYYENYHTVALTTDSNIVKTYTKVTYKNIYPNIDWVLYIKDNKIEYDFIVNPVGKINDIKIRYNGSTDIANNSTTIDVTTPLGKITEKQLYAYDAKNNKQLPISYTCKNNIIGFALNTNPPPTATYVIDPTLAWATYFGDIGLEQCDGKSACDKEGNVLICGLTSSLNNIATTGSYQTTYMSKHDAFIAKFTGTGTIVWATYYGGEDYDLASAVVCDKEDNIYITGQTGSFTHIATSGSHQQFIYSVGYYMLVAKFNSLGYLIWGTYYAGDNGEGARDIAIDKDENIFITGEAVTDTELATPGSFQDTLWGLGNAFLSKFNSNGVLLWATYFGKGTGFTGSYGQGCATDKYKNCYIVGGVYDTGIVTTPGCYQSMNAGGYDCFIAKFDSLGALLWSTYYGGDGGEGAVSIISDTAANIYITGSTFSPNGIASAGAFQTVYGGEYDGFLAKFDKNGNRLWATYYGGNNSDDGASMALDGLGSVYLAGSTGSPNNIATSGSYQPNLGGSQDAFLAKFTPDGMRLWATYFGGAYNDICGGISSDGIGNIYLHGYTFSPTNIATSGSYDQYYSDSIDVFLARFDTGATGISTLQPQVIVINITPNPNDGNFLLSGKVDNSSKSLCFKVMDMNGKLVYDDKISVVNGVINKNINIQNMATGIYTMVLNAGYENKTIQLIIK